MILVDFVLVEVEYITFVFYFILNQSAIRFWR